MLHVRVGVCARAYGCACMRACAYINMYEYYIILYMRTCVRPHLRTRLHACECAHVCVYVCVIVCTCVFLRVVRVRACVVRLRMFLCMHVRARMGVRAGVRACANNYMHV